MAGPMWEAWQAIWCSSARGIGRIALSGGVFANVLLQERCRSLLEQDGFLVYVNEQVPGNDGGICLGQAWIAMRE